MKLEKHRYVIFKYFTANEINEEDFIKIIWGSIDGLFGCKGSSETGLWVVDFNTKDKIYSVFESGSVGTIKQFELHCQAIFGFILKK